MEKATIVDMLEAIKWGVQALAELGGTPGSYEKENARNAARGIVARIEWCVAEAKELQARTRNG